MLYVTLFFLFNALIINNVNFQMQLRVFPFRNSLPLLFCQDGSRHVYRIDRGSDLGVKGVYRLLFNGRKFRAIEQIDAVLTEFRGAKNYVPIDPLSRVTLNLYVLSAAQRRGQAAR